MDCPTLRSVAPRAFGLLFSLLRLVCGAEGVLADNERWPAPLRRLLQCELHHKMRRVVQLFCLVLLLAGTASAQGWTAFSPEGGRCKVDMPGTPMVAMVPLNSPGQSLTMTEAKVRTGGATFFMSWVDYPDRIALSASSDTMLDKVRDGMAAGNTLCGEKKLTLGHTQGREFTVAQANGTITAVRLYWARNRLYQLGESFALARS